MIASGRAPAALLRTAAFHNRSETQRFEPALACSPSPSAAAEASSTSFVTGCGKALSVRLATGMLCALGVLKVKHESESPGCIDDIGEAVPYQYSETSGPTDSLVPVSRG